MTLKYLVTALLAASWSQQAYASVTAQQATALGTTLTKFGAIQAGSPDGAIPPYTGGIAALSLPNPPNIDRAADPFSSEKPLFSISSSNMSQYSAMLTPGTQALIQKYPGYVINVYPTHRTESYPPYVLQNTVANATTAQIVGDGDGVTGAYGGIPFPIPQTGDEVMWNNNVQYRPPECTSVADSYLVDASGGVTNLGNITSETVNQFYNPTATSMPDDYYRYYKVLQSTPATVAGNLFLFKYPVDFTKSDDITFFYSPGTRRVRLAPEFKYDTPVASYGGAIDYDEVNLFYGRMDKFDFHLVGVKEMIIPYNVYAMTNTTPDQLLGKNYLNPDLIRWERHRVWEVDATLKPGKRHSFSRWTFYIDEDSWSISAWESYDHAGNIYKVAFSYPSAPYGKDPQGGLDPNDWGIYFLYGIYNMSKGDYEITGTMASPNDEYVCSGVTPNMSEYTPQAMAAEGIR